MATDTNPAALTTHAARLAAVEAAIASGDFGCARAICVSASSPVIHTGLSALTDRAHGRREYLASTSRYL